MGTDEARRQAMLEARRATTRRALPFFCSWWAPVSSSVAVLLLMVCLDVGVGLDMQATTYAIGLAVWVCFSVGYMAALRLVARRLEIPFAPWHIRPPADAPAP